MLRLIDDIAQHFPPFSHVRSESLLVGMSQARCAHRRGLYAKVVPLRFENGHRFQEKGLKLYEIEPLWYQRQEVLYLIYFVLPRFQNLSFEEKLTTVFHELYHISPKFNGDIRRFPGARFAHTCSKKGFDATALKLGREYLKRTANSHLTDFLKMRFKELERQYGQVVGKKILLPKLKLVKSKVPIEPNGQMVFAF